MSNELFIATLALAFGAMLVWGFICLPGDRWQFLAAIPLAQQEPSRWKGLNITWYGLLVANAQALAAALFLLLISSLGVPWKRWPFCWPPSASSVLSGSRWLAQLVEKKAHTFTVGGASFLGILLAPGLFWAANKFLAWNGQPGAPLIAWCAALTSAYALGEGLGRLACISFGCCYGKPLDNCSPWLARLFSRANFTFSGDQKKIAYASGWQGRPVLPVQALTATIYVGTALAGSYLFLRGQFTSSLLLSGLVTQLWRALSEFIRADFRGGGRLSAYQWMALATALGLSLLAWLLAGGPLGQANLFQGLRALWAPGPLMLLQGIWVTAFIYYGRSRVTTSVVNFSVQRHLI